MMQRVLMTAGASGIGKEIARAFVAKGARVCVCDIDVTAMETAAKDIAALAVFLASDAAKSFSGQMLPIDNDMQASS